MWLKSASLGFLDSTDLKYSPWKTKKRCFCAYFGELFLVCGIRLQKYLQTLNKSGFENRKKLVSLVAAGVMKSTTIHHKNASKHTNISSDDRCIPCTHYNPCGCLQVTLWAQQTLIWSKNVLMSTHLDHHQGVTNLVFLVPHFSSDLDVSRQYEAHPKGLAKNCWKLATQSTKNPESVT